jgi:hypothetical protein
MYSKKQIKSNPKNQEAKEVFHTIFKGHKNFFTPDSLAYYKCKKYFIELSEGKRIFNEYEPLYGVTVIDRYKRKHLHNISKPFHDLDEAYEYINKLCNEPAHQEAQKGVE